MPKPRFPSSSPAMPIDKRFPTEVWCSISIYLYPSQLSRLSMVSKALTDIVSALPDWAVFFARAHDSKTSLRMLPDMLPSKSYMLYMCATSLLVCEECFRKTDVNSAANTSFPLPVNPSTETLTLGDRTVVGCSVDDAWTVLMCLKCRISHFNRNPELIPRALHNHMISTQAALAKYHMDHAQIGVAQAFNGRYPDLLEANVLRKARLIHGGDIGIIAFTNNGQDRASKTRARVHEYSLQ